MAEIPSKTLTELRFENEVLKAEKAGLQAEKEELLKSLHSKELQISDLVEEVQEYGEQIEELEKKLEQKDPLNGEEHNGNE